MLTRVYIDNYRCFANFELKLGRRQLLFGGNGTGKSSLLYVLLLLRNFLVLGRRLDEQFPYRSMNRASKRSEQTFEIEGLIDGDRYVYKLLVEQRDYPGKPLVRSETVTLNTKLIFEFKDSEVRSQDNKGELKPPFRFDPGRSAFQNELAVRSDNQSIAKFGKWLDSLAFFQINPFNMSIFTDREDPLPDATMANFPAWYRHLVQADREADAAFLDDLRESIDGFRHLDFLPVGESRLLQAKFETTEGNTVPFTLAELSDGQRCLIGLYAILHFSLARGKTVFLDEPDNFISLREIQPWLLAVEDRLESGSGQALIISHHPEIINQWAADSGIRFYREGAGPVRTEEFQAKNDSGLAPAELIARGHEGE